MRTVIVICTQIIGHCINPQIITPHMDDMPIAIAFAIGVSLIIAIPLDLIDLKDKLKKTGLLP